MPELSEKMRPIWAVLKVIEPVGSDQEVNLVVERYMSRRLQKMINANFINLVVCLLGQLVENYLDDLLDRGNSWHLMYKYII